MVDGPEARPPTPVTVSTPGMPASSAADSTAQRGRPSRLPVLVLLLLPVVLLAVRGVRDARRHDAQREAVAAERLRLTVVSATAHAGATGIPGLPSQIGVADVVLRNDSRTSVRILDAGVDGGGPISPGAAAALRPGAVTTLAVRWQVLCAEVGTRRGPGLLHLHVRLGSATTYALDVPLPGKASDRAFHEAVVTACDVLVPR